MSATPAEIVRTLLAGAAPGQLHQPEAAHPLPVAHTTDAHGAPLLLVDDTAPGADALRPAADGDDVATLLTVADLPAYPSTPGRGEAVLAGWVRPLAGAEARAAVDVFAAAHPLPELLDVGATRTLYRMDVAEVRLERDAPEGPGGVDVVLPVELADYHSARPDPFSRTESDLLADLNDHHPEVHRALLRWTRGVVPTAHAAVPVALDRYGLLLRVADDLGPRHLRMAFRTPIADPAGLAAVLRSLTCRCAAHHDHAGAHN